jgi:hypothetical protein
MANELIQAFKSVKDALVNEATAEGLLANITVREFTPGDVGQADCPLIMYRLDAGKELLAEYVHKAVQTELKFSIIICEDNNPENGYGQFWMDETGAYSRGLLWLLERVMNAIDKAYFDNDTQQQPPTMIIKEYSLDNNISSYTLEFVISTKLYERGTL